MIYFGTCDEFLCALTPQGELKWKYKAESKVRSFPAIGSDGTIFFDGEYDDYFYAVRSKSRGLADSPWPKEYHDNQNTGRAR